MLVPAHNPAGKEERPIHHWKDAEQEVNTFPRKIKNKGGRGEKKG